MRGSKALAVAVRNPDDEIVIHTEPLDKRIYGGKLARMPFLRGLTLLWDALGLGIKSLMFSAEVAIPEDEKPKKESSDDDDGPAEPAKVFDGPMQVGTVLLSLTFSILLFFVLPTFGARGVANLLDFGPSQIGENVVEGVIRLALLIGYVWAIGLMPDVKRLYGYHGAEHKTINAYEADADLTPASVARFPLEHPRCGTAFLLTVVVISILIYSLLPPLSLLMRVVSRIVLLPIIAGIAYEFLKFTAVRQHNPIVRLITKPNLALQRLTTREPDEGMLEVAIAAFEQVMAYENNSLEILDTTIIQPTPTLGEQPAA